MSLFLCALCKPPVWVCTYSCMCAVHVHVHSHTHTHTDCPYNRLDPLIGCSPNPNTLKVISFLPAFPPNVFHLSAIIFFYRPIIHVVFLFREKGIKRAEETPVHKVACYMLHTVNSRVSHENTRGQKWKMGRFILTYGRQWCGDAGSYKTVVSQMTTVCLSTVWPPSPLTESVAFTDQWNWLRTLWDRAKCRHGQGTGLGLRSTLMVQLWQAKTDLYSCKAAYKYITFFWHLLNVKAKN